MPDNILYDFNKKQFIVTKNCDLVEQFYSNVFHRYKDNIDYLEKKISKRYSLEFDEFKNTYVLISRNFSLQNNNNVGNRGSFSFMRNMDERDEVGIEKISTEQVEKSSDETVPPVLSTVSSLISPVQSSSSSLFSNLV